MPTNTISRKIICAILTFIALPNMESSDLLSDLPANRSIAHPINQTNQSDVAVEAVQSETALRVAFSMIAGSAFVLNLMFCVVLLKKPAMMKKPYNTLLFNLAITDLFTGEISYKPTFGD